MTICWHIDDLKISHVNPGVTATREKIHDYLGMTFDFYMPGEVKVSMDNYIDKVLTGFPEEIFETAPSPAGTHFCKI